MHEHLFQVTLIRVADKVQEATVKIQTLHIKDNIWHFLGKQRKAFNTAVIQFNRSQLKFTMKLKKMFMGSINTYNYKNVISVG